MATAKVAPYKGQKIKCDGCKNTFELGITLWFYAIDIPLCEPCAIKEGF